MNNKQLISLLLEDVNGSANLITEDGKEYTIGLHDPKAHKFSLLKVKPANEWIPVKDYTDFFSEIKCVITGLGCYLDEEDISAISGCIGYAMRKVIRGEDLSNPEVILNEDEVATITYYYDSTKTQSDDPDFIEAFEKAKQYIIQGTPVYKSNRIGKIGERLIYGLDENYETEDVKIEFFLK